MAVWSVFNLGDSRNGSIPMKKFILCLVVAFFATFAVGAQTFTFDEGGDTAGIACSSNAPAHSKIVRAALSANPIISITDSVGPVVSNPNFAVFANAAVKLIKDTGTLPSGAKTNITDPRLATYVVPTNFVNGSTVWSFVELKARNAGETVSLSQITFVSRSLDPANSLGKTNTFGARDYTETAIGIRADGSVITSGPSSQECVRVIVGIGWKSYVANTPAQVQEVIDYIAQYPNWGINPFVSAGGATFSRTLTTVDPQAQAEKPMLSVALVSGVPNLVVGHSANHTMTYEVQTSTTMNGTFSAFTNVVAGGSYPLSSSTNTLFVRYKP